MCTGTFSKPQKDRCYIDIMQADMTCRILYRVFHLKPNPNKHHVLWHGNEIRSSPPYNGLSNFPGDCGINVILMLGCCCPYLRRRSAGASKMYLRAERVFSFDHCIASKSSAAVCGVRTGADKFLAFPIFLFAAQRKRVFLRWVKEVRTTKP
jgi:hypothetical protein